jgi:hypothetical protein
MRVGIDAHKMKCTTVMFDGDSEDHLISRQQGRGYMSLWKKYQRAA